MTDHPKELNLSAAMQLNNSEAVDHKLQELHISPTVTGGFSVYYRLAGKQMINLTISRDEMWELLSTRTRLKID